MSDKQFRSSVAALKRLGILPPTLDNGQKLDARSAYPRWKVKGKKLETWVNQNDDILSGKAAAIKLPPAKLKEYKKNARYETRGGRLIVPHSATEKVKLEKGEIKFVNPKGIERVQIPVPFHDLERWAKEIKNKRRSLQKLKSSDEYFAFRFFGNNSSGVFQNIDQLIANLRQYRDFKGATTRLKQDEVYRNIEIVRIQKPTLDKVWQFPSEKKIEKSKEYNRRHAKEWREKLTDKPEAVQERYRKQHADRQKAYRQRLKQSPKQYDKVKQAAKERQKKYRDSLTESNNE